MQTEKNITIASSMNENLMHAISKGMNSLYRSKSSKITFFVTQLDDPVAPFALLMKTDNDSVSNMKEIVDHANMCYESIFAMKECEYHNIFEMKYYGF